MFFYFFFFSLVGSFFVNPNYQYLDNSSNWDKNTIGVQIATQYRGDRASNSILSMEYTGSNINNVFRFKTTLLTTSGGSLAFGFGAQKDIFFTNKLYVSTYITPSIFYANGEDKKNASNGLKFIFGAEFGVMISSNSSIGIEWRHISSNYTTLPNIGIDSVGIKYKIAF
jgi:hypothetical protein